MTPMWSEMQRRRTGQRDEGSVAFAATDSWSNFHELSSALRQRGIPTTWITAPSASRKGRMRRQLESALYDETRDWIHEPDRVLMPQVSNYLESSALDLHAQDDLLFQLRGRAADIKGGAIPLVDKAELAGLAEQRGVATPRTWRQDETPDEFPVIVKSAVGYGGQAVRLVDGPLELARARRDLGPETTTQEYCPGEMVNVGGVARAGSIVCSVAYRPRVRAGDPHGPPVGVEIVDRPELALGVQELLGPTNYTGFFCFDHVADKSGRALVIDVNLRVFGAFSAVQETGTDLVGAYVFALGLGSEPRLDVNVGARTSTLRFDRLKDLSRQELDEWHDDARLIVSRRESFLGARWGRVTRILISQRYWAARKSARKA